MAKSKAEHVVVDAVAFFRNVQLQNVADNVHTLRAVVNEIRDKATRQRLSVLPYDLKYREPSTECIQIVSDFARKTGDYQSLSAVDIRVIALAYQLTKEHMGTDHLKKDPEKKVTYSTSRKPVDNVAEIAGFFYPSKKADENDASSNDVSSEQLSVDTLQSENKVLGQEQDVEDMTVKEKEGTSREESNENEGRTSDSEENPELIETVTMETDGIKHGLQGDCDENDEEMGERTHQDGGGFDSKIKEEAEEDQGFEESELGDEDGGEEDDDDNVGWITPKNISQAKQQMGGGDEANLDGIRVGCMTTDFAMQNVLIQIGIPVISVNGMLIKRAKSFVLKCHDCFKVTFDMGKVFCPKCGNKSLDKVTMTIDDDGTRRYHMSKRRPQNTRGLRYALPKPQGGKHATNPTLCADQRVPHNRDARKAQGRTNVFDPDFVAGSSPFATHDVTSRSAQLGVRQLRGQGSAGRRNPNENRRQQKKGRKK